LEKRKKSSKVPEGALQEIFNLGGGKDRPHRKPNSVKRGKMGKDTEGGEGKECDVTLGGGTTSTLLRSSRN